MNRKNTKNDSQKKVAKNSKVADYSTLARFIEHLSVLHLNEFYHIMKLKDNFRQFMAMDRFLVKVECREQLRQLILKDWFSYMEDKEAAAARDKRRMNVMGVVAMMISDDEEDEEDIWLDDDDDEEDEEDEEEAMKLVAVKVFIPHEDPMLPEKTLWMEDSSLLDLYSRLSNLLIKHRLPQVRIQRYARPDGGEGSWIYMDEKKFNHFFYNPKYMMLQDLPSERRLRSNIHNFMCLHTSSGTVIHILVRKWIQFKEISEVNARLVTYKFTYTRENGDVVPLIAAAWLNHEPDAEEIQKYKYDILKGSAIWFCEHLQNTCDQHIFYDYL